MSVWIWLALGLVLAAFAALVLACNGLVNIVIRPPRDTVEEAEQQEIERGNLAPGELASFRLEPFKYVTEDGLSLCCYWLRADAPTKRAVVLVHGFGSRHEHMLKYAKLYLPRGYDVLLFDHRNCGESEGKLLTMGYRERRDLQGLVSLARAEKGEGAFVGVHGESMGGATVVLTACMEAPPDFVVADCPYADLTAQLTYNIHSLKRLPAQPFLAISSAIMRLRAGFMPGAVSPLRELEQKGGLPGVPMLFIHGTADRLIPYAASEQLFAAKAGKKGLYLCEGAEHSRSIARDRTAYAQTLAAFLGDIEPN